MLRMQFLRRMKEQGRGPALARSRPVGLGVIALDDKAKQGALVRMFGSLEARGIDALREIEARDLTASQILAV